MCTTTSEAKGNKFTGFIYIVLLVTLVIESITGRFIKFRGNKDILRQQVNSALSSKFRGPQKTVGPSHNNVPLFHIRHDESILSLMLAFIKVSFSEFT